jgi:hypothetical protein
LDTHAEARLWRVCVASQFLKFASQASSGTTADVRVHHLRSHLMTKTVAITGTTAAVVATITLDPYKSVFVEVCALDPNKLSLFLRIQGHRHDTSRTS